jgi:hypothetical protein
VVALWPSDELAAEVEVVAVFVRHRLAAAGAIEDAEACVTQGGTWLDVHAAVVSST